MIDLDELQNAPLVREPFDHLIVSRFIRSESVAGILEDFPAIEKGGSFPASELSFGERFEALLEALRSEPLRRAVEAKFAVDLEGRPAMVTVRGQARPKDGRIHTDSRSKIVTVLLYMNSGWKERGGWLRLLRSAKSLDDYFAEVPPEAGTAVFFRCTRNAWHGHTPFVGARRAIQLNWVLDDSVVRREQGRHRLSARLKKYFA
jgi:hypothetical protein